MAATPGHDHLEDPSGMIAWSIQAIMTAECGDGLGSRLAPALGFVTLFFGIGLAIGPFVAVRTAYASGSFGGAFSLAAATALLGGIRSLPLQPVSALIEAFPAEPPGTPAANCQEKR